MNEQKYNRQEIIKYLTGALPEATAERFDELSFTDAQFTDALDSTEKDLIDAYLYDELDNATLENFKSYYLISPSRREKVKIAEALQIYSAQYLAKKSENVAAEKSNQKSKITNFFSALNIFNNRNPILQWSFAVVALLFVMFGGWWIINRSGQPENQIARQTMPAPANQNLPNSVKENSSENANVEREIAQANVENKTTQPKSEKEPTNKTKIAAPPRTPKPESPLLPKINIASFLLVPSLRGNNRIQNISVAKEITDVAMRLQLESDDYATYRVALTEASSGKIIWRGGNVKAIKIGENKMLDVKFSASLLKSQIYSLQVSGVNADGAIEIISDYPFRIVR